MALITGKSNLKKTPLLLIKALSRRIVSLGIASVFTSRFPSASRVIYIDIGMHKNALQMRFMKDAFDGKLQLNTIGFEAHPDYFREAVKSVRPGKNDRLLNLAVVGPGQGKSVTLHVNGGDGLGDSLIRSKGSQSIVIPSIQLSQMFKSDGIGRDNEVVILRMNIEGAELYVLEDLLKSDLVSRIDGYYGYWDDPLKIGGDIASRYKNVMAVTQIDNFPFNDRDFKSRIRLSVIKYDLTTSILAALRRRSAMSVTAKSRRT
jgi:FkbM family methyltransferase